MEWDKVRGGGTEWDNVWEEIERREKKLQENERRERIGNSRYNKWYGMIKNEGLPGILEEGLGRKQMEENSQIQVRK